MMKKLISLILALMLLTGGALAMERASVAPDWDSLEKYAAFEETGTVWTVRSNQTQAALNKISAETAPYNGYAFFGMELTGDKETGLIVPVLAFYYAGSVELNGEIVSIAVDGARYDLALAKEVIQLGKNRVERLTAPLDADGLYMVHEILNCEEPAILLQGDTAFEMEPMQQEIYENSREEMAAASLSGLSEMLYEFEKLGDYGLWDLNEIWWERTRGVEPKMNRTALPAEEEIEVGGIKLEAPMYMLSRQNSGEKVRKLQELLADQGYMMGKADGSYGGGSIRAVRAAQKFLGLMETGCADENLISILTGEAPVLDGTAEDSMMAATAELLIAEGLCEMTVERSWMADAVESEGGERRTAADKDDTLIIWEGTVKNLSAEELDFYWQLSATAKLGEYEYPCVLVCERNEGASLTSALPPLGEARMLIFAEIPETAAANTGWTLEIEAEDTVFVIE